MQDLGLSDDEPSDSDPEPVPPPAVAHDVDATEAFEGESSLGATFQLLEDGLPDFESQSLHEGG